MKLKVLTLTLMLLNVAVGQERPALVLGMDAERIQHLFGAPIAYYDSEAKIAMPKRVGQALEQRPTLEHVYEFKTSFNAYQLSLKYSLDSSQSRLHPTKRLGLVRIELDRKVPLPGILDLLQDMPEARELCGAGCAIRVVSGLSTVQIYVQPVHQTSEDVKLANTIYNEWGRIEYRDCYYALRLFVDMDGDPTIASGYLQTLSPDPPEITKRQSVRELGIWQPSLSAK